jgi:hypothetical protein
MGPGITTCSDGRFWYADRQRELRGREELIEHTSVSRHLMRAEEALDKVDPRQRSRSWTAKKVG